MHESGWMESVEFLNLLIGCACAATASRSPASTTAATTADNIGDEVEYSDDNLEKRCRCKVSKGDKNRNRKSADGDDRRDNGFDNVCDG